MTDFVEYIPKRHGQKPDYWTPDTLTGLDGKNYVRQPNWAWIAGTTYYVPYEAVHGRPRPAPVDADADADRTDTPLRDAVARAICEAEGYAYEPCDHYYRLADAALRAALQETER